jgi:predicted transcriptional regulator
MPQSVLEMTKDLVSAEIQIGRLSPEDMDSAMRRIYQSLQTLKSREESESPMPAAGTAPALVDWPQSITRHNITCLECGAQFRQLAGRHLRLHGLDAPAYRAKFGIPETQPLSARATAAKRRQITAEVKPWEKTPNYKKSQEKRAVTAQKAGRKKGTRKG